MQRLHARQREATPAYFLEQRSTQDHYEHKGANRIAENVNRADLSGVSGTPTFFINRQRHYGAYDTDTLAAAVRGQGEGDGSNVITDYPIERYSRISISDAV